MTPNPTPADDWTESRDTVLVEFNDTDHPWEVVSRDVIEARRRRGRPQDPAADTPPAPPN